jgi:hypothetical protein
MLYEKDKACHTLTRRSLHWAQALLRCDRGGIVYKYFYMVRHKCEMNEGISAIGNVRAMHGS